MDLCSEKYDNCCDSTVRFLVEGQFASKTTIEPKLVEEKIVIVASKQVSSRKFY